MPGGSHNRNTKLSLRHALHSRSMVKLCKCPLHRNVGKGTLVPQIKFKRHGADGVQGMCSDGKTLIDSYSHMLNRLQLLSVVSRGELEKPLMTHPTKYSEIINNIKNIIDKVLLYKNINKLSKNDFKLYLLTKLDKELRTKNTNFYDINMSPKDKKSFVEYLKDIFTPERIKLMEYEQKKWTKGGFIKDSKDGKIYPIQEFVFNVSKKREFYNKNGRLTPYRVNIHNTRARGQRSSSSRGEKYLSDGQYTEANRRMKELGNGNKNIHADHFIPLALGGIHDVRNLRALPGRENIYKKDKLTRAGFRRLKNDPSLLSKRYRPVFRRYQDKGLELTQEKLKDSVYTFREKIINMPPVKKFIFIQKFYPNLRDSQVNRIITKYFTKNESYS